jgi:phosphoheptose isomerase
VQRSAREITFNNGSSLRVDTTLRGGSYPLILISEFGKTCARNPQKAEEVITGTLQAVPRDGKVIIESTAEGNDGFFAEMVMEAHRRGAENLSSMEYNLFFYPWMSEPTYVLTEDIHYDVSLVDYFTQVEKETGLILTKVQKNWYAVQTKILGDKIKQEFPSTISEAFLSSSDAYFFAEKIAKAYQENRCLYSSLYDALQPVYVSMDIGINDLTVLVFFQVIHGEIRVIDYYEDRNKDLPFYARFLLQDKKYHYNTIFLPHDSVKRDPLDISNSYERDFRRLFQNNNAKFHVLKRMDKQLSISHSKVMLDRCVFNLTRVKPFLDQIAKYRKKWCESTGRYLEEPYHNEASNFADAFRYMCQAVAHLETTLGLKGALEKHKLVTAARYSRVI